jgi:Ca2+-binding RTX toxin-like protein
LNASYQAESLNWGAGEDTLTGRLGNDSLNDGDGKDVFAVDTATDSNMGAIVNLVSGTDEIQFIETVFAPLDELVELTNDLVLYAANSAAERDADSSGSAGASVEIALLSASYTHTTMTETDFAVI